MSSKNLCLHFLFTLVHSVILIGKNYIHLSYTRPYFKMHTLCWITLNNPHTTSHATYLHSSYEVVAGVSTNLSNIPCTLALSRFSQDRSYKNQTQNKQTNKPHKVGEDTFQVLWSIILKELCKAELLRTAYLVLAEPTVDYSI